MTCLSYNFTLMTVISPTWFSVAKCVTIHWLQDFHEGTQYVCFKWVCVRVRACVCEKLSAIFFQSAASTLTRTGAWPLGAAVCVSGRSVNGTSFGVGWVHFTSFLSRSTRERASERARYEGKAASSSNTSRSCALPPLWYSVFRLFYRTCVNEERGCWDSLNGYDYAGEKQNPLIEGKHGESAGLWWKLLLDSNSIGPLRTDLGAQAHNCIGSSKVHRRSDLL